MPGARPGLPVFEQNPSQAPPASPERIKATLIEKRTQQPIVKGMPARQYRNTNEAASIQIGSCFSRLRLPNDLAHRIANSSFRPSPKQRSTPGC
jgi:hypothetical protein